MQERNVYIHFVKKMLSKCSNDESGHTLLSVMIFMIIIMLILLCLMKYIHVQHQFLSRDSHQVQADYLAESGIAFFLNDIQAYYEHALVSPDQMFENVYVVEADSITVHALPWGGFIKVNISAQYKSATSVKQALIGQKFTEGMHSAITLDNVDNPLVLVGDAEIYGDVYVGTRGVKSGNIKGTRFRGQRLVNGDIITSTTSKMSSMNPDISFQASKMMLDRLESEIEMKATDKVLFNDDSLKTFLYSDQDLSLDDFAEFDTTKACTLVAAGALDISGDVSLPDYSILIAGDSLTLKKCQMSHALVYCRKGITVSKDFQGDAQLLSEQSIVVDANASLNWPSIIFVDRENPKANPLEAIQVNNGASIQGALILSTSNDDNAQIMNSVRIEIKENAEIFGLVYTNLGIEHQGIVNGHISLRSFYLYKSPTHYINYLMDGKVDRIEINADFPIPLFFSSEPQYTIFDWRNGYLYDE